MVMHSLKNTNLLFCVLTLYVLLSLVPQRGDVALLWCKGTYLRLFLKQFCQKSQFYFALSSFLRTFAVGIQQRKKMIRLLIVTIATVFSLQVAAQNNGQTNNGLKNFFKLIKQDAHPTGVHDPFDFYVGPRLGISAATLTSTGGFPVFGPTGSAFFEVFVLKNLSIGMEIGYSYQGAKGVEYTINTKHEDGTVDTQHQKYDYSLHYINATYLCRWYPISSAPLSVYSGLHLARLISAHAKSNHRTNITDELHEGDVGIPVGVSYEWGQWQADMRYTASLRHIGRTARAKQLLDNSFNNMLSVTVAYKIQLW